MAGVVEKRCSFAKIQAWECFDADMGKDSAREIREYFIPDFSHWQDEKSYRRYRPLNRKCVRDYFFKETEDLVNKLNKEFVRTNSLC